MEETNWIVVNCILSVLALGMEYDYVTCGSSLKLMNVRHNVRLHSHDVKYGSGSGQQVCFRWEHRVSLNQMRCNFFTYMKWQIRKLLYICRGCVFWLFTWNEYIFYYLIVYCRWHYRLLLNICVFTKQPFSVVCSMYHIINNVACIIY